MRTAWAFVAPVGAALVACAGGPTAPASTPPTDWFAGTYELQAIESEWYPESGALPTNARMTGAACGDSTSPFDGTCFVRVIAGTLRLTTRSATGGTARIVTTYRGPEEEGDTTIRISEHPYTVLGRSPDGAPQAISLSLPSPGQICFVGGCNLIRVFIRVSGTTAEVDYGYYGPETWRYMRL